MLQTCTENNTTKSREMMLRESGSCLWWSIVVNERVSLVQKFIELKLGDS